MSLSSFSLQGSSAGCYISTESGSTGTWGFVHLDNLTETFTADLRGSARGGSEGGALWSFTSYSTTYTKYEQLTDSVGGQYAAVALNDQQLVQGSGGMGTLWETASGQPLVSYQGHTDGVSSVTFSPDGR